MSGAGGQAVIELVYTVDSRYLAPLCASLCSVLTNLAPCARIRVHVIGDVGRSGRAVLDRTVRAHRGASLESVRVDERAFLGLPLRNGKSAAIYYVLALPRLLPELDKVIYLDADVVVEADLSELWRRELDGRPCLGVLESAGGRAEHDIAAWRELGLAAETPCLNSGVLLIDLAAWRRQAIGERAMTHMRVMPTRLHDQEGLNAVLRGNWGQLEPEWNVSAAVHAPRCVHDTRARLRLRRLAPRLVAGARILHFHLTRKAWHVGCPRVPQRRFLYYLERSGCLSPVERLLYRIRMTLLRPLWAVCEVKDAGRRLLGLGRWRLPDRHRAAFRPVDRWMEAWMLVLPRIRDRG